MAQQTEIECKYHIAVHERDALRETLHSQCVKHRCVEKHDTYYTFTVESNEKLIRIRRTKQACVLTYKEHHLHTSGVEKNTEYEVKIDDEHAMHAILRALGTKLYVRKYKLAESFTLPRCLYGNTVTVELVEVPPLGHFVEIECIADASKKNLTPVYDTILRVVAAYNLSHDALEKRPYIAMLKSIQKNSKR